ncbi:non-ribosomal peptide synthetase [Labedaea rhizosphaerae]|uniref:Amino acid adenylation domain-containing protein n=1 Tax=Labedaea rhizosphaerae TaxID=598644 RepID=A0A4R6RUE1_LABRH|nr:non-ribosomal peptide synthetase [Labedaea rhizosphaerae]TDP89885.1 amino acid adenylation domain-containing protein [Labedaea rhizosphaerae]
MKCGEAAELPRSQRRLWFTHQLDPSGQELLVPLVLRFTGPLDVAALRAAVTGIVARHEVLRTSVITVDDEPKAVVRPVSAFALPLTELSPVTDPRAAADAELRAGFDLANGLPIRARLFRMDEHDHLLCVSVHHIAFDGWSAGVFQKELTALYAGQALEPLPAQFREVALEADARLAEGDRLTKGLEFWRNELAGAEPFELPTDRARPPRRAGRGVTGSFTLPAAVVSALDGAARARRATLFTVLLAASQVFCYRASGRTDVVTGTSVAEREQAVRTGLIGPFLGMLVLRNDLAGNPAFGALVAAVRRRMIGAFAHRHVPFDLLVEELAPERDLSRTPLFGVLVDIQPGANSLPELPGVRTEAAPVTWQTSRYDTEIAFSTQADGTVACRVTGDAALYRADTVRRWASQLETLLTSLAAAPDTSIDEIPMATDAELAALRAVTVPKPVPFPQRGLHEFVDDQAAATPNATAVINPDGTRTSYRALVDRADAIARSLAGHGVRLDDVVGVQLDRGPDLIPTLLGVLKAGAAFLPLETDTPPARVAKLLAGAKARLCVAEPGLPDSGRPTVTVADLRPSEATLPRVRPLTLCSIYCTSGSTGEPKRVASTHEGWVNRMAWMQRRHGLRLGEVVLHKTTLTFDDAAVEVFWPLMTGGTVALLGPGLHRDPRAILEAGARHDAVHVQFVPSMLEFFVDTMSTADLDRWPSLRSVLSSGEALRPALVRRFAEAVGGRRISLDNTWGATEVSIDSTCHVCEPADYDADAGDGAVSLGTPIDNNEVYVLDEHFRPVPAGVPGELYLGGVGLARGYLHDPRRTAESFVPHFERPGQRLYRTGDRGRLRADGSAEFLGRADHQVKIRGVRIELGEIESVLHEHPGIADAVAVVHAMSTGPAVVGYVVPAGPDAPDLGELRAFAASQLSGYAVPGALVSIPALPLLASGKLDRRALPAPAETDLAAAEFVAPRTATEQAVAELWAEALGRPRVGATDDFFALGGHSLLAIRVTNRMSRAFGVPLSPVLLFEHRTVDAVAEQVTDLVLADIDELSDADAERLLTS